MFLEVCWSFLCSWRSSRVFTMNEVKGIIMRIYIIYIYIFMMILIYIYIYLLTNIILYIYIYYYNQWQGPRAERPMKYVYKLPVSSAKKAA